MGGGSSKSKPEAPPQVVAPVNIMVTKEVTERWASLSQKKLQQKQEETKTSSVDGEKIPTPTEVSDSLVSNSNLTQLKPQQMELVVTGNEKGQKLIESSNLPSIPSSNELPPSSSKSEEELGKTSPIESGSTSAAAASTKSEEIEIVQNYDNMDMFANFFVPKDSSKLRYDMESGLDIEDHLVDYETRYSAFLRKPNDYTSEKSRPLLDEKEDETRGIERKHSDFMYEEVFIGENNTTSGEASQPQPVKEIRVPKPALPVVVDEDEEGKMTIESLQTWKLRERFEKEITKNNLYWTEELQRLTAKMEDEARTQGDEFQMRIDNLNRKYADVVEKSFKNGPHCNLLVSHIGRCYQTNNDQVLKCNDLVRQFAKCTSKVV